MAKGPRKKGKAWGRNRRGKRTFPQVSGEPQAPAPVKTWFDPSVRRDAGTT